MKFYKPAPLLTLFPQTSECSDSHLMQHFPSKKIPYLLAKNSHDVHRVDFLVPYFMVFWYCKLFRDCCGEQKG